MTRTDVTFHTQQLANEAIYGPLRAKCVSQKLILKNELAFKEARFSRRGLFYTHQALRP